jgi:hypothetical protein
MTDNSHSYEANLRAEAEATADSALAEMPAFCGLEEPHSGVIRAALIHGYLLGVKRHTGPNSDWIDIEERLPEARYGEEGAAPVVSEDVLCIFPDALQAMCNYDHEAKIWTVVWTLEKLDNGYAPTHWMTLPESPK